MRALRDQGLGGTEIAWRLCIGRASVYRALSGWRSEPTDLEVLDMASLSDPPGAYQPMTTRASHPPALQARRIMLVTPGLCGDFVLYMF